jgi:hypothetical protein
LFQDTALSPELIQAFLETHYRVHQHGSVVPTMTLRVGDASPDLIALHRTHGVDCSAFLTAYNPFAKKVDDASNLRRQEALKQELSSRSLTFLPGEGQHLANGWPAEPDSTSRPPLSGSAHRQCPSWCCCSDADALN